MAEHNAHEFLGPTEEELKASVAAGYELNDVSLSVLVRWGMYLGVFLVATSIFALILFFALQRPPFGPPAVSETILGSTRPVPPVGTPIVQDNPAGDPRADNNPRKGIDNIREFRREEEIRMTEYATQDGKIHIPLDRAMEIGLKHFNAQQPGEAPTGVTPVPEMKLHPTTGDTTTPSDPAAGPTGRP